MQITSGSIAGRISVFENILEDVPGGVGLNVTRLDYLTANKEYIQAGTPVYVDLATRVAEVCKTALGIDGGGATAPRVNKLHHFLVGDYLNDGTTGAYISAIDSSDDDYDVLTVNTAVTYAAGTKFFEGTVSGTSAVLKYTPNGMVKSPEYIKNGNADVPVVKMGTVREDALVHCIPDLYKTALRSATGTSLITLV